MKKRFKIGLIVGILIVVVLGVRIGFTKIGIIPNRLGVKALCVDCKGETFLQSGCARNNSRKKCCKGTYRIKNVPCISGDGYFRIEYF